MQCSVLESQTYIVLNALSDGPEKETNRFLSSEKTVVQLNCNDLEDRLFEGYKENLMGFSNWLLNYLVSLFDIYLDLIYNCPRGWQFNSYPSHSIYNSPCHGQGNS